MRKKFSVPGLSVSTFRGKRLLLSVVLLFALLTVMTTVSYAAWAIEANSKAVTKGNSKAEYVADELIIKFKSNVEQDMASAIANGKVDQPTITELNKKYKVKKAAPLFRKRLGKTTSEGSKMFQDMIKKARGERGVSVGNMITDLSNIYLIKVEEGYRFSITSYTKSYRASRTY